MVIIRLCRFNSGKVRQKNKKNDTTPKSEIKLCWESHRIELIAANQEIIKLYNLILEINLFKVELSRFI